MKKLIALALVSILVCGILASCVSGVDSENTNNSTPTYSEEQLKALGTVMVGGDFVGFQDGEKDTNGQVHVIVGTITFIDKGLHFAALGHIPHGITEKLQNNIYNLLLVSAEKSGLNYEINKSERTIGLLENYFETGDGLFGEMSGFQYDPTKEMEFGMPEEGDAFIYLEMPDDKSDWYAVNIEVLFDPDDTQYAFSFSFTDARLPDDFVQYDFGGRSGSPLIQNGKIVGAFCSLPTFYLEEDFAVTDGELELIGSGNQMTVANFAADMRFAQLQKYDENFNAELFRDVPTLRDYFD